MYLTYCFYKKNIDKSYLLALLVVFGLIASGCSSNGSKRTNLDPINGQSSYSNAGGNQACSSQYRVVSGDSLSVISVRCNVKMSALAKANNLKKPYTIRIGQVLTVPGLTASNINRSAPQSKPARQQHRGPTKNEIDRSYQVANWQWPMQSKLEHRFVRDSSGVTGLEINCSPGLPVLAVASGEAVYVGSSIMEFGLMVMLKHATGHISVYAHNSQVLIKEGQTVKAGQLIARSGSTGLTDRSKVYIEARYRGKKVDIQKLF